MKEASKALLRRLADQRFATRYFVGEGIDVGCGDDNILRYKELFPLMVSCRGWDMADGDAQFMQTIQDETYDFVHSSHCLEHLADAEVGLTNWLRILKPGGHLIVTLPDEDLYEQGVFPSTFNSDHKWTFTIGKTISWSSRSISLLRLLAALSDRAQTIKLELIDASFRYGTQRHDQTAYGIAECAIEFIMRKWTAGERQFRGRIASPLAN